MRHLFLPLLLLAGACASPSNSAGTQALQQEVISLQQQIEGMREYKPGLIHTVFFWLRPELSESERAAFMEGVRSLGAIKSIRGFYVGPPAPTPARDVIDTTYSVALIVHFDDVAGEEAYQVDPIHLAFVENNKQYWSRVRVYDSSVE